MSLIWKNGTHWIDCSVNPPEEHKLTELEKWLLNEVGRLSERLDRLEGEGVDEDPKPERPRGTDVELALAVRLWAKRWPNDFDAWLKRQIRVRGGKFW